MRDECLPLIKEEFKAIMDSRFNALKKINLANLNFNPFLLRLLNLDSPRQIAEFMVSQRVERGTVTSFGTRIQKIAKIITTRGTGVEGADISLEKGGRRYYIQVKSGPNTTNKDIVSAISKLLHSAQRRNHGSVGILGLTIQAGRKPTT